MAELRQSAPYPEALASLIEQLEYRPGWRFDLADIDRGQGSEGLTFRVYANVHDSYHPEERRPVWHYFPVPPAAFNEANWKRWLLDRLLEVEVHEACEYFVIDGERPYAPRHGPGNDPYTVVEYGIDEERRTSFRGEVKSA